QLPAADRWRGEDGRLRRTDLPDPDRQLRGARFRVPRLRQRVLQHRRFRRWRAACLHRSGADVALADGADHDQLRVPGQEGRRRPAGASAVHLWRLVLTAGPAVMTATPAPTVAELAERFSLGLQGDGARPVHGVGTLAHAGPGQLSFLANPRYRSQLAATTAGAVVMRAADAEGYAGTALIAGDPYTAFAKLAAVFEVTPARAPGIHRLADVHPDALIDPGAHVAAFCSVGARSRIEAG